MSGKSGKKKFSLWGFKKKAALSLCFEKNVYIFVVKVLPCYFFTFFLLQKYIHFTTKTIHFTTKTIHFTTKTYTFSLKKLVEK